MFSERSPIGSYEVQKVPIYSSKRGQKGVQMTDMRWPERDPKMNQIWTSPDLDVFKIFPSDRNMNLLLAYPRIETWTMVTILRDKMFKQEAFFGQEIENRRALHWKFGAEITIWTSQTSIFQSEVGLQLKDKEYEGFEWSDM